MTTVAIRELRERASELLRQVEAGEPFHVTDRGRAPLRRAERSADESPELWRFGLAGALLPAEMRTLGAIHLATAHLAGSDLTRPVTDSMAPTPGPPGAVVAGGGRAYGAW